MSYTTIIMWIVTIFIVIFCVYIYTIYRTIKKVYSAEETNRFLKKDIDLYVQGLSEYDLRARKCRSSEEYINRISSVGIDISYFQKYYVGWCANQADSFFENLKHTMYLPDTHGIHNIEWNIAFFEGDEYEDGMPHTRTHIIFLPKKVLDYSMESLTTLLIHEKIHIYQRYNGEIIDSHLKWQGYAKKRHASTEKLIRKNPDINQFIYTNPSSVEMYMVYNSENPKSINDAKNNMNTEYEHPYEMISYEIEKEYATTDNYGRIR